MLDQLTSGYGLFIGLLASTWLTTAAAKDASNLFERPIMARMWQQDQYALAQNHRSDGNRVSVSEVASTIARLNATYVSGLLRFRYTTKLTQTMINDFNQVRTEIRKTCPDTKFDVELNFDPKLGIKTFADAKSVTEFLKGLDSKLHVDGWWWDYLSTAWSERPDWVHAAVKYAHDHNQTVGGNVWGTRVPDGVDAVAFNDWPTNGGTYGKAVERTKFGFGIARKEVEGLKKNTTSAVILGHLNNNPQNGNSTESCVYINDWGNQKRNKYLDYWMEQEKKLGFKYFLPVFFPECPGAYAFSPLGDSAAQTLKANQVVGDASGATLFEYMLQKLSHAPGIHGSSNSSIHEGRNDHGGDGSHSGKRSQSNNVREITDSDARDDNDYETETPTVIHGKEGKKGHKGGKVYHGAFAGEGKGGKGNHGAGVKETGPARKGLKGLKGLKVPQPDDKGETRGNGGHQGGDNGNQGGK